MPGGRLAACAIGLAAAATCTGHPGVAHAEPARSALVVFFDADGAHPPTGAGLSLGLVSAAEQAGYSRPQFLLDVSQGARIGLPGYAPRRPPMLRLTALSAGAATGSGADAAPGHGTRGRGAAPAGPARVTGWAAARRRAAGAEGRLQPGLLAAAVSGGAAYAGPADDTLDAVIAAGAGGRIGAVALGGDGGLLERLAALRRRFELIVADLPRGAAGRQALRRLASARAPGELLVAVERARTPGGGELLWGAVAGLDAGAPGELGSASTQQRGLVSAVDLAPTILRHLGARIPPAMQGRAVSSRGRLDRAALGRLRARLGAIPSRRLPALAVLLAAWAALVLVCARRPHARGRVILPGARRPAHPEGARSERADGQTARHAQRRALRVGALGVLWAPCVALVPAAIEPGAGAEYALIAGLALGLGAASDALLGWPRGLIAPAVAVPVAIAVDAAAGTQLLMRSLAGPDPIGGARFYGVGNELKSALAVTALAGVAAAVYPLRRHGRRRAAVALGASGLALLIVEGWARIGAAAGGAVLVSAGFALTAALVLAPARPARLRGLIALTGAAGGLALLIAIDLLTARGRGHLQGTVLDARSLADLRDEVANRYATAWRALRDPGMALAVAAALVLAAAGVRLRARLLAPVGGDALFAAAFAGGLLAGACGALVEDSGPLLLVEAVLALACVAAYLHAGPPPRSPRPGADRDEAAYASSSAAPSPTADRPTIAVLGGSQGTA